MKKNFTNVPCWFIERTLLVRQTVVVLALSAGSLVAKPSAEEIEFFETKIRPVLAQECYECHNSRGKAKSGLVLDYRGGLLKGGDYGPSVVPGKPDESILMEALRHENDLTMPKAGVKLDPPIVADFEKWIAMGAPDPRDNPPTDEELAKDTDWNAILETRKNWWSFQPVQNPKPPAEGNAIDAFVRTKLREENLEPSEAAGDLTLARRLYFALIGLPPSTEQLNAFREAAAKDRQAAVSSLIDELLASDHFGERWARHWMDWVRYAETHGSEGDPRIGDAYLYRDYLIRALNDDIPYDQLLTEHVAGDLLEKPRTNSELNLNESVLGAIHWRLVFHGFAPTDALDEKVRFTDDQINTFTKAFQGLTVSCARCHNHKFDAISQADYYAMFGVLGSTRPGRKLVDLPAVLDKNKDTLTALKPEIRKALAADWLVSIDGLKERLLEDKALSKDAKTPAWLLHPFFSAAKKGANIEAIWQGNRKAWKNFREKERAWLAETYPFSADLSDEATYREWFRYGNGMPDKPTISGDFLINGEGAEVVTAVLPAGAYSTELSSKHGARLTSKNLKLDEKYELHLQAIGANQARARYVVQNYPRRGTVFKIVDLAGKEGPMWSWAGFNLDYWEGDEIHVELSTARDTAVEHKPTDRSWFGIRRAVLRKKDQPAPAGDSREFLDPLFEKTESVTTAEEMADAYVLGLRAAVEKWRDGKADDSTALFLHQAITEKLLPNQLAGLKNSAALVTKYRELESQIAVPRRAPGIDEWVGADQALYDRGDHKKPTEVVPRRFLDAIDPTPFESETSGRMELAQHLLRSENPFTRRVIVNRIWTHLFGNGIVATADNFGRLGEKPSHPELLDHLATKFSDEQGWSIKAAIREIVSSQTWQQASTPSDVAADKDPGNRLLSHYPVRRLEAEAIRDNILAVSGNLKRDIFGSPVGGNTPRRSVYVQVIRNRLDPFLNAFDAPIPFSTVGKRPETNVPAQSLTMLNDGFVVGQSRTFARRFNQSSDKARVSAMWFEALGRKPRENEMNASLGFLDQLRSKDEEAAAEKKRLNNEIGLIQAEAGSLMKPTRAKLEAALKTDKAPPAKAEDFGLMERWDFETPEGGSLKGTLKGKAKIEGGDLVLNGGAFFSEPLKTDLVEKTLEVLVTLSKLDQKAGGAMTIQDLKGGLFDSIVYSERRPKRWMPGSNNFARTDDFNGTDETQAADRPVRITMSYAADGTIRCYRDGKPYGDPVRKAAAQKFEAGRSQIVLGLRHGTTPGGGRVLLGRIHEARLFDNALSDESVAALAGGKKFITRKQVLDSLTEAQRKAISDGETKRLALQAELEALGGGEMGEPEVWSNFAHSLFNLKEFIYVY